jgi:hypothetical protein
MFKLLINYTKEIITTFYFERNEVLLTIVMNSKQHWVTVCCFWIYKTQRDEFYQVDVSQSGVQHYTIQEFKTSGLKNTIQKPVSNNNALKTDLLMLFWINKTQRDEFCQASYDKRCVYKESVVVIRRVSRQSGQPFRIYLAVNLS